jgi:hypothetical protein
MSSIRRLFEYRVSSEKADSNFASLAAYFFAVLVMVIGITKIGSLQATEIEILLATIGIVSLSMLTVAFGLLIELNQRLRTAQADKPGTGATQ